MRQAAIIEEMVFASTSMDVALDAAELHDWAKAEHALLDVQERSARLLRELGIERKNADQPHEPSSQVKTS